MNNNYYQNPIFSDNLNNRNASDISNNNMMYKNPLIDQNYIENILKVNKGKMASINATFPGSIEWQDKTFEGIIENTGKDHIIISNPNTGQWNIIPIIYLDFITFDEPVNYS